MIVVDRCPHNPSSKNGNKYPETRVIWGIARKIRAAMSIQKAYLNPDLARAYPPSVPRVSEIVTTLKVTKAVFSAAFQKPS